MQTNIVGVYSNVSIAIKAVLLFLFPIIALVHSITNRRISTRDKVLWGIAIAVPWPFITGTSAAMAYAYSMAASQRRWLKILANVWMFFFIVGSALQYFNTKKELTMLEVTRLKESQEIVRSADRRMALEASKLASPPYRKVVEHMRNYQRWLDQRDYKQVVNTFKNDEPVYMKGDPAMRRQLSPVAFDVALAYRGLGEKKKSAYYYALAAKVLAETDPHNPVLRTYIDEAKALDPSNVFAKQVEQSIFR